MNRFGTSFFLALGLGALTTVARGSITETNANNPYLVIVERNAFALKPPPPPPAPVTNAQPEVHNVKFTGISRDANGKRAYLIVQDANKPGQPAKPPEYYCLAEGERQGDIEVKTINEAAETVTILNGHDTVTLNFKEHGNTASPQTAPGVHPGIPLPGAPPAPRPLPQPAMASYPGARTPVANLSEAVNAAVNETQQSRMLPTRSMRTQPSGPYYNSGVNYQAAPAPPPVDPEAQKALMLINSQLNAGQGPPLPPLE